MKTKWKCTAPHLLQYGRRIDKNKYEFRRAKDPIRILEIIQFHCDIENTLLWMNDKLWIEHGIDVGKYSKKELQEIANRRGFSFHKLKSSFNDWRWEIAEYIFNTKLTENERISNL